MGTLTNSAKLIEKIQNMRSVVTGNTAPSNPSAGDLWYDTTSTVKALKMYDGTNWVIVGPELVSLTQAEYDALPAAEKSNGKFYLITDASGSISIAWSQITGAPISSGSTAPSNPNEGDIWYDTTNDVLKAYDGTNWNEVGSDAADINTKTFYLSNTGDTTNAKAALDWYLAGKNPIIIYNNTAYIVTPNVYSQTALCFCAASVYAGRDNSKTTNGVLTLAIIYSGDTVTSIQAGTAGIRVLETDRNYSTPYTPQYAGSPATKKYVDDNVNVKGFVISSTSDTINAQAAVDWYVAGNTPIVIFNDKEYVLSNKTISTYIFQTVDNSITKTTYTTISADQLNIYHTNDVVSGLATSTLDKKYLDPEALTYSEGGDYIDSFTPTSPCQPATKKYVDDLVGDIETLLAAI